jgi:4-azaleucine resistance transporter AzlC
MPASVRDGIRAGLPLAVPTVCFGAAFGVLASSLGWGVLAPVAMSVFVFSSSAQFAAAGVLATAGGPLVAIASGALANLRFIPFGVVAAPALRGGPWRRAVEGQAVNDASLALATRDGEVSRGLLLGATVPQAVAWMGGTALGAGAGLEIDPAAAGLDVVFPAFFLALLWGALGERRAWRPAAVGGIVALALIPFAPAGLPILGATLAAVALAR